MVKKLKGKYRQMAVSAFLEEKYGGIIDENADKDVIGFIKALDALLDNQQLTYIVVPERVEEFIAAYKIVKDTFAGTCNVEYVVRDNSHGCVWDIKVSGKDISIIHPRSFTESVLDKATCFEFVPYLDGRVEFNISFSNMAKKG